MKNKYIYPIPVDEYFSPKFQSLSLDAKRDLLQRKALEIMPPRLKKINAVKERMRKEKEKLHKKLSKIREKNIKIISHLRAKGVTLEDIGKVVGLTRERVRQIERDRLHLPLRGYQKKERTEKACANPKCKNKMSLTPSLLFRKYCSRKCQFLCKEHVVRTPTEQRAYNNKRCKAYYHKVLKFKPEFREKVKRWNKMYQERHKTRIKRKINK